MDPLRPDWLAALDRAAAFDAADPAAAVERVETHISWVFLVGDQVWKLKKPVDFGFLDFTRVEARRAACEAEVVLNRRLAPEVYLGVEPLCRRPDGSVHVGAPGEGDVRLDWAVHMRRVPDADRADVRLAEGRLGFDEVGRIAQRIAAFHAACRADDDTARFGTPAAVAVNVAENVAQTREALPELLDPDDAREIVAAQTGFIEAHDAVFHARIAAGRVRDGHGDLRLEHVYLDDAGGVLALDCIEFNDRFRYADVAADLAFLAMDLTLHGRADLAEHLLAAYAEAANDHDLYRVVDFYEGYRAFVRAKVATFVAADPSAPAAVRERARAAARHGFLVALGSHRPRALAPMVVAVGGPVAAGKSTVARQVSRWLAAPIVEADRTRKAMLGVSATTRLTEPGWKGAYDPRFTEEVYREVVRRGEVVLGSGRPVVLDASFRSAAFRREARALAARAGVPFRFVECQAPREVLAERLRARERDPSRVSDARVQILDDFLKAWEPVEELAAEEHVRLDTRSTLAETLDTLRARLPSWPAGLTG